MSHVVERICSRNIKIIEKPPDSRHTPVVTKIFTEV